MEQTDTIDSQTPKTCVGGQKEDGDKGSTVFYYVIAFHCNPSRLAVAFIDLPNYLKTSPFLIWAEKFGYYENICIGLLFMEYLLQGKMSRRSFFTTE